LLQKIQLNIAHKNFGRKFDTTIDKLDLSGGTQQSRPSKTKVIAIFNKKKSAETAATNFPKKDKYSKLRSSVRFSRSEPELIKHTN
jgi:hypothetical protein